MRLYNTFLSNVEKKKLAKEIESENINIIMNCWVKVFNKLLYNV